MSEEVTENDYVATAAAEKRLREVIRGKFGECKLTDDVTATLLDEAEITYLSRKKTVSILLRLPDTAPAKASSSKVLRNDGVDPTNLGAINATPVDNNPGNDDSIPDLPHDRGVVVQPVGTVGQFQPRAIDDSQLGEEFFE